MVAHYNEPHLLFSIGNISAYHLQDGEETSLTPSGPQTLSLLMVSSASPFADLSTTGINDGVQEDDFYLHIHLPPELDLSLPATTQIYHQPPRSYLIPRWDMGPGSGAFTRIEFPKIGSGVDRVSQDEVDTFETILAQCTAFLEKSKAPIGGGSVKAYNPSDYKPGEGYVSSSLGEKTGNGQLVLIDEENGSVVGELSDGFSVVEGKDVKPGSKKPVEIALPTDGNQITINEVSEEYLRMARHPAYKNSTIVQNAATASRLIVTGSSYVAKALDSGALAFSQKTKPNPKPMHFSPAAQDRIRKINNLTHGAVGISAATVGQVGKFAQNFGARLAGRGDAKAKSKPGEPATDYQPGILNKSMIAFSTIADGIEQSARHILNSGAEATSSMVSHRYGAEAGQAAGALAGGVKNVGLVYIDATGVSRKAVIKSVAKGMVVGRMPNGEHIMVGEGDGGQLPAEFRQQDRKDSLSQEFGSGSAKAKPLNEAPGNVVGFGNATVPPPYSSTTSGVGEPLGSTGVPGGYPREKSA